MNCANTAGSGISSRQEVGEITMRPSYRVTAKTSPMPSLTGRIAEKKVMRAPPRYSGTDGPVTRVIVQLASGV